MLHIYLLNPLIIICLIGVGIGIWIPTQLFLIREELITNSGMFWIYEKILSLIVKCSLRNPFWFWSSNYPNGQHEALPNNFDGFCHHRCLHNGIEFWFIFTCIFCSALIYKKLCYPIACEWYITIFLIPFFSFTFRLIFFRWFPLLHHQAKNHPMSKYLLQLINYEKH